MKLRRRRDAPQNWAGCPSHLPLAAGTSSHYSEPRHLSDNVSQAAADIDSRPSGALQSCPGCDMTAA